MSKTREKMGYIGIGISAVMMFVGVTTFFTAPAKDVKADVSEVKKEVANYKVEVADRLGRIETTVSGLTERQKETQADIKEVLQIIKKR